MVEGQSNILLLLLSISVFISPWNLRIGESDHIIAVGQRDGVKNLDWLFCEGRLPGHCEFKCSRPFLHAAKACWMLKPYNTELKLMLGSVCST